MTNETALPDRWPVIEALWVLNGQPGIMRVRSRLLQRATGLHERRHKRDYSNSRLKVGAVPDTGQIVGHLRFR